MSSKKKLVDENDPYTYVECEICGEKRRLINHSHLSLHGYSREEYLDEFPLADMCSQLTSDMRSSRKRDKTRAENSELERKPVVDPNDSSTYVICQICDAKVGKLTSYHVGQHGIDMKLYKELFPDDPVTSEATRTRVSEEQARRLKDPEYYDLMCDNLATGRETMDHEARLLKSHTTRKGRKNRPDHGCKGWAHVWASMTPEERREFIDYRFEQQSTLGYTGPKGCIIHYTDRNHRDHTFKSRHELAFAVSVDLDGAKWNYEPYSVSYIGADERTHQYRPDFVVVYADDEDNESLYVVEVKPYGMSEYVRTKLECVRLVIPDLVLMTHDDLDELGVWKYVKDFNEGDEVDFNELRFAEEFLHDRYAPLN